MLVLPEFKRKSWSQIIPKYKCLNIIIKAYFYLSISTYLHSFLCSSFEDSFWYLLYLKKYNNKKKTKGWWNQNYPSVLVFMINQLKVCREKHQRKQQQSTKKRSNCNLQYFVVVFEMLWILLKERGYLNWSNLNPETNNK